MPGCAQLRYSYQIEVLPSPPELIPRVWRYAQKWLKSVPNLDLDRARLRLLSGEDRLWLAVLIKGKHPCAPYLGVIITTVSDKQPFKQNASNVRKAFRRTDPELRRSLVVHIANGKLTEVWIDQAVERISAYGREQKCRQVYILARLHWRAYACKFWAPDWDIVGYSRDRPTKARCSSHYKGWNTVGWYRVVQPIKTKMRVPQDYQSGTMCYFTEGSL